MAETTGAESPAGDKHPGEIQHIDHVAGREWVVRAVDVPQAIAWVCVEGAWQPVVRIEASGSNERREITRFGADGAFLDSTVQAPPPTRSDPPQTPMPQPK